MYIKFSRRTEKTKNKNKEFEKLNIFNEWPHRFKLLDYIIFLYVILSLWLESLHNVLSQTSNVIKTPFMFGMDTRCMSLKPTQMCVKPQNSHELNDLEKKSPNNVILPMVC